MVSPETLPTPDLLTSLLLAGTEANLRRLTSPLCSAILSESCHQAGVAALAAEVSKFQWTKMPRVGLVCIPLAVETCGYWRKQAHDIFSRLASYLDIHHSSPKSSVVAEIYGPVEYDFGSLHRAPEPSWPGSSHPRNC